MRQCLYLSGRTAHGKSLAIVIKTKHGDELNVMNPKQNDCVFLKIYIGFEIKGKTFGKSNFKFAGLCPKNSSRCFTEPPDD